MGTIGCSIRRKDLKKSTKHQKAAIEASHVNLLTQKTDSSISEEEDLIVKISLEKVKECLIAECHQRQH